jgi:hypothetical protein
VLSVFRTGLGSCLTKAEKCYHRALTSVFWGRSAFSLTFEKSKKSEYCMARRKHKKHKKHRATKKAPIGIANKALAAQPTATDPPRECDEAEDEHMHYEPPDSTLAIWGFVVAALVLIVYLYQLKAMLDSNETNRAALESVQRALVSFNGQPGKIKRIAGKTVTSLTMVVPWENSGVTPAINGKSMVNWKILPAPNDLPRDFTYPDIKDIEPRQFEIPPKGYGNGTMDIPVEWIEVTKNKTSRMFIYGWITYDDIFKQAKGIQGTHRHLSEFCDEVTNITSNTNDVADPAADITWELSLCREHNCSDESCKDYAEKTE